MAIESIKVTIDGVQHTLTLKSPGVYEKTGVTAPNKTSWFVNGGHYYPVTVEAKNTAGTITTANDSHGTLGPSLKLTVKEKVKPTITWSSPGAGAFVSNSKQAIIFFVHDEINGSGINIASLKLQIDSGAILTNASPGMVIEPETLGYYVVYTPQTAMAEGLRTVKVDISDNDGNAATQAIRTFTVDTVPPVLNVTSPSFTITNNATVVVAGTTNDATSSPVTITIKKGGVDQGAVTVTAGSFSKSITLTNGANVLLITATDASGQKSEVTLNVTLDTSTPVISSVTITPNPVDAGATMVITVNVTG